MYLVFLSRYLIAVFSTNRDTGAEAGKTTFLCGFAEMSLMSAVRLKLIEWENDLRAALIEDAS